MIEKPKQKPRKSFWDIAIPFWLFVIVAITLLTINFFALILNNTVEYLTVTATPRFYGASNTDYTFIETLGSPTPGVSEAQATPYTEVSMNTPMCKDLERTNIGQFIFRMFLQDGMELFRIDENGENFCRLTRNISNDDYPAWSPDGNQISYVSLEGDYGLYLMDANGENIELLHTGGTAYSHPAWSPDGQYIVFQSTFDELFDIYQLELATGNIINLTNQERLDNVPAYSPNGEFVVFTSDRIFNPYTNTNFLSQYDSYEIYMMNSDGTNPRRLTVNDHLDSSPSFSPDSSQIVFGDWQIRIMNKDGSGMRDLTYGSSPLWLHDGRIAYLSGGIRTILPDGTEDTVIINNIPSFGSGIQQWDYTAAR